HETAYRRVRGPLYVGAGFHFDSHSDVRPAEVPDDVWKTSDFVVYSERHGLPLDSQQSGGISANVLVDKRVGEIDPRAGWMAQARYRASFDGFLGGDSSWQLTHLELRTYTPLGSQSSEVSARGVPARHRLAIWTFADLTTGTPPY